MRRERKDVSQQFSSFRGAREREPGIHFSGIAGGAVDSQVRNCAPWPAPFGVSRNDESELFET
jgi:hypothetical protein